MGGVPVLFLLVAMGITYGWQPDGNGGVEYVIQIPPEQLEDLKRSGELTSVINPKVQSHVSRVIVKVGNETLQEITPPELNQTSSLASVLSKQSASNDGSHVPVPEMSRLTIGARESVMKPADGFSLPPSLDAAASQVAGGFRAGANDVAAELERRAREAAAATAGQTREAGNSILDRAGNALRNAADTALGRSANLNVPAQPDPRFPNKNNTTQPPSFTGTDPTGELARARQGIPSTEPASQRDRTWTTGGRMAVPSTEPVGPPDLRSTASNTASIAPPTNYTNQQTSGSADPLSNTGGYGANTTFGSIPADLRTTTQDPRYTSNGYDTRSTATPSYGTSFGSQNTGVSTSAQPRADVDPRLTAAQLATLPQGAWSFDVYGRPIDRDGRVLDQWGRPVDTRVATTNTTSDPRLNSANGYDYARTTPTTDPVTPAYPNPNFPAPTYPGQYGSTGNAIVQTQSPYPDQRTTYPADPRATLAATNGSYYPSVVASQPPATTLQLPQTPITQVEQPSQSTVVVDRTNGFGNERTGNYASGTSGGGWSSPAESHGPLFNTLLLVSAVGNIYLCFWLRNLRYRFRDLVAAKRVIASNSSAI